jgi:ribosome-binding factor A
MTKRQDRLNELFRETAAEFVSGIANPQSLITVTRADVSPDIRACTIFFTTIPATEQHKAEDFLNRHAAELRSFAKGRLTIKRLPFFTFKLDVGERHRQRLDEISQNL